MAFILKYRVWAIAVLFAVLGLVVSMILKLGELKWYYIIGTPLIALVTALLGNLLTDTLWNKKLREKAISVSIALGALFFISFFIHLKVFVNGTFRYRDVNNITRTYIKGYDYTDIAKKYKAANPALGSDADLLYDGFGGIEGRNDVWSPASIRKTTIQFVASYCSTVFFLAALITWIVGVFWEKRYADPQKALQAILNESEGSNFEKYLLTAVNKKTDEKYKQIRFHIFLSYATAQRKQAEAIYYALTNRGHMVFFDRSNLPPGMEYNTAIHAAIMHSDLFIFLISPEAVTEGHYTLSELKFAADKWPAATGVLLPVMCIPTTFDTIPAYAQSVTILDSKGNLVSEITATVENLYNSRQATPMFSA